MESDLLISAILVLLFFLGKLGSCYDANISRTITVNKNGHHADFTTVQQAIDSVPSHNSLWTRILLNHGVYSEKIVIPKDKPYIILEGDSKYLTTIEWGDAGHVRNSSTFTLLASNFVARHVYFKNTYDRLIKPTNTRKTNWAVAALIFGDKASFYQCSFLSLKDTLWDARGRHYFYSCNISGAIDFIWGNGQGCLITSLSDKIGTTGYITAQGREGPNETTGFVFKNCHVSGSGTTFLGRAYRNYSRVLFVGTYMRNVITPEGWSLWTPLQIRYARIVVDLGQTYLIEFHGKKKLSHEEVRYLTNTTSFINQDGWLEKQPK
ncbi:hypothetical protein M0R45_001477 [Rubus argutus]|uniref:pectinesterase n=1 Tax=Rubus argutus TaxID=59490 RepID=A0AAW1VMM2_RUBAR